MTIECYIPNKTTDVPLSVTYNCMPHALHRGKLFNVKNDDKAHCRALHAFLCIFWLYVRLSLRNESPLQAESYL